MVSANNAVFQYFEVLRRKSEYASSNRIGEAVFMPNSLTVG